MASSNGFAVKQAFCLEAPCTSADGSHNCHVGDNVKYVDDETIVMRSDNILVFMNNKRRDIEESTAKKCLSFESGYSLDAFTVLQHETNPRILVALTGKESLIRSYSYPLLEAEGAIEVPNGSGIQEIDISKCGNYLAAVTNGGTKRFLYWEFKENGRLLVDAVVNHARVDVLIINPFNPLQILIGELSEVANGLSILVINNITQYRVPSYLYLPFDTKNSHFLLETKIVSAMWTANNSILFGSHYGQLILCTVPNTNNILNSPKFDLQTLSSQVQVNEQDSDLYFCPGVKQYKENNNSTFAFDEEIPHITAIIVSDYLPFVSKGEVVSIEHAFSEKSTVNGGHKKNKHKPAETKRKKKKTIESFSATKRSQAGATAYSMLLSYYFIVIGTDDGHVIWLNRSSYQPFLAHQLDYFRNGIAPKIISLSFSSSFREILCVTSTGAVINVSLLGTFAPSQFSMPSERATPNTQLTGPLGPHVEGRRKSLQSIDVSLLQQAHSEQAVDANTFNIDIQEISKFVIRSPEVFDHNNKKKKTHLSCIISPVIFESTEADNEWKRQLLSCDSYADVEMIAHALEHEIQLWRYNDNNLPYIYVCNILLHRSLHISALSVSPDGRLLFVGFESGKVMIYDITNRSNVKLISSAILHNNDQKIVEFKFSTKQGECFFSILTAIQLYFCTFTQESLEILGVIHIDSLEELYENKKNHNPVQVDNLFFTCHCFVTVKTYDRQRMAVGISDGTLIIFDISSNASFYRSELNLANIGMVPGTLPDVACALCMNAHSDGLLIVSLADKTFAIIQVKKSNSFELKKINSYQQTSKLSLATEDIKFQCSRFEKPVTCFAYNNTSQILATSGADGVITIFNSKTLLPLSYFHLSSGEVTLSFSSMSNDILLASGSAGFMFSLDISELLLKVQDITIISKESLSVFISSTKLYVYEEVDSDDKNNKQSLYEIQMKREEKKEQERLYKIRKARSLEYGEEFVDENIEEKKVQDLMIQFEEFRRRFQTLVRNNEEADELEQLPMKEFAIDLELREMYEKEGAETVKALRDEIIFNYEGKELVRERIKQECWDDMEVKGSKFNPFVSGSSLHNFAMRAEHRDEKDIKRKILFARKLEQMQDEYYEQLYEDDRNSPSFSVSGFTSLASYVRFQTIEKAEHKTKEELMSQMIRKKKELLSPPLKTSTLSSSSNNLSQSLNTSFASTIVKHIEEFLYHPLDCYTVYRKRIQATVLALKIKYLKETFNKKFQEYYLNKQREIDLVLDKSKRIEEIQNELHLTEPIFRPKLSPEEISDSILTVDDSEITAKKVLSLEEQKAFDERQAHELKMRSGRDDAPRRALEEMMNGTLEMKRDLTLLEEELVKEDWMDTVPENEMTEEQLSKYFTYQKQLKLIQQEQENRRKLLYTELSKLKSDVNEIFRVFDTKLKQLANERILYIKEINQIEMMQIKLLNDVVKEEAREASEKAKVEELMVLQKMETMSIEKSKEFQQKVDTFTRNVEAKIAQHKQSERSFKKDFMDAGEHVDTLYKMFRHRSNKEPHRPRISSALASREKMSSAMGKRTMEYEPVSHIEMEKIHSKKPSRGGGESIPTSSRVPNSSRPIFHDELRKESLNPYRLDDNDNKIKNNMQTQSTSLTQNLQCPDKLELDIFLRFLDRRATQLEREKEIKQMEETLHEMTTHLNFLLSCDKEIADKITLAQEEHNQLLAMRRGALLNTEVILEIEQGKVEIEESPVVTDMKSCEMIPRTIVEELSLLVRKYGNEKVDVLKEIMACHTAIQIREWTLERQDIELRDQMDLNTELQLLRVTKNLQTLIKVGGHDSQKAAEIKRLNQKKEFLQQSSIEKMEEKRMKLKKVKNKIRNQQLENNRLLTTVGDLEQSVRERLQISQLKREETQEEKRSGNLRMKAVVTRRKLVDLAKLQSEEVEFLRTHVEGLRKRTFASFALPTNPVNPDEMSDLALTYEERSRMSTARSIRGLSRDNTSQMSDRFSRTVSRQQSRGVDSRQSLRSAMSGTTGMFGDIPVATPSSARPFSS